ncbi:site-specific integrase [Robertkochia marina]|uniref:Site-specific integrase n=1 Tax=Robertkochia marina TaxID=1227945 RepID=A0A4S3LYX6_9FLAO|nr:site-specific integrase [Robertkochia marina]THD66636.1 site-specific integrase [Robertkochia marina]TRZ45526.1 site-specific integrase [Robertkochia marina]
MSTTKFLYINFWTVKAKALRGKLPVYARVTVEGKRAEISTQIRVEPSQWDVKSGRIVGRSEKVRSLNKKLAEVEARIHRCYEELRYEGRFISAVNIKKRYSGEDSSGKTLKDVFTYHKEKMKGILAKGTLKNYGATEKYIFRFLKRTHKVDNLVLKELESRFIVDFEHFLRQQPTLNNNGVMKHLERFKKLIKMAYELEWMDRNIFRHHRLKFQRVDKEFLSQKELEQLINLKLERASLKITRDIFLFSCYTSLAYADVKELRQENLVQKADGKFWIKSKRAKTGVPLNIPLLPIPLKILERYREHPRVSQSGLLLPVYSNQKINAYLKEIAIKAAITKKFTFHTARHTFATTVTLSNGMPIETVSKLLGHTKLATTQIYARVLQKKIGQDMEDLERKLAAMQP